jgi:hypothetical protein
MRTVMREAPVTEVLVREILVRGMFKSGTSMKVMMMLMSMKREMKSSKMFSTQ